MLKSITDGVFKFVLKTHRFDVKIRTLMKRSLTLFSGKLLLNSRFHNAAFHTNGTTVLLMVMCILWLYNDFKSDT